MPTALSLQGQALLGTILLVLILSVPTWQRQVLPLLLFLTVPIQAALTQLVQSQKALNQIALTGPVLKQQLPLTQAAQSQPVLSQKVLTQPVPSPQRHIQHRILLLSLRSAHSQ